MHCVVSTIDDLFNHWSEKEKKVYLLLFLLCKDYFLFYHVKKNVWTVFYSIWIWLDLYSVQTDFGFYLNVGLIPGVLTTYAHWTKLEEKKKYLKIDGPIDNKPIVRLLSKCLCLFHILIDRMFSLRSLNHFTGIDIEKRWPNDRSPNHT